MKSDDLLDRIGRVDDKYITELCDDMVAAAPRRGKSGGWRKWAALAACLALVIVGGLAVFRPGSARTEPGATAAPTPTPPAAMATVILDVNPSIQLTLDPDGAVESVSSLNDDAAALLGGRDYKGEGCAQALREIVAALEEKGYLTNMKNSVLVTVVEADGQDNGEVCRRVTAAMQYAAADSGFQVSILSQVADAAAYAGQAKEYGISVGKAALVDKIASCADGGDYADLAALSIHALDQIMDCIGANVVQRTGEVAGTLTNKVEGDLGISDLDNADALDLAEALAAAYDELCQADPQLNTETYTGYDFHLDHSTASDGTTLWTITAENKTDSSLPSVSVQLRRGLGIVQDITKSVVDGSLDLVGEFFGLPRVLGLG